MSQLTAIRRQPPRTARAASARPKPAVRLRVVQPAAATGGAGFVVGALMLLAGGLVALLLLNTARAQQSFTLDGLQNQVSTLADTQQELATDLDDVSAPQQLALRAQALGLAPATRIRYVRASDGKVVGVAKAASAQTPFTVGTLPTTPASRAAGAAAAAASVGIVAVKPKQASKASPVHPGKDGTAKSTKTAPAKKKAAASHGAQDTSRRKSTKSSPTSTR